MKTLIKYKGFLYVQARTVQDLTEDYLQEMRPNDWVRIFHGTHVSTGARLKPQDMVFGIDALGEEATSKYHPNTPGFHRYSGIFVAPTLKEAGRWGSLIFEVAVKARNLHPTNWSAKIYKKWDAEDREMFDRRCKAEYPNSFYPALSGALSTKYDNCASGIRGHEPQALFKGITKSRDVLAVHYFGEVFTPQEFIKKYQKDVSYYEEAYKSKGPDPKSTTLSLDEYLSIVKEHVDKDPKDFFSIISRYWAIDGKDEALRLIKQLAPFSTVSAKRFLKLLSEKYCDVLMETWERVREKRPDLNLGDPPRCQQRAAAVKYNGHVYVRAASYSSDMLFLASSIHTPKGWCYDHVGFVDKATGNLIQMSGHRHEEGVFPMSKLTDDPVLKTDHYATIKLPKTVTFTDASLGAVNCVTFVIAVLKENGINDWDREDLHKVFKCGDKKPLRQALMSSGYDSVDFLSEEDMKGLRSSPLYGVISITDLGRRAELTEGWGSVLRLQFDDIEESEPFRPYGGGATKYDAFTKEDAKKIKVWLKANETKLSGIYVHCWAGVSRSAAVAKYIAEEYGIPFDQSYDKYNTLVYDTLRST